uniref:LOW QUALITY PROTEIN: SLAIN motif-containing protein 1 n=1 Tax=Gasterosteus aculeatus aculeatus TaxID=481459 RepID=UPI001A995F69|nr:LOW QUALITY PROTEIN: SLAIN motif-containing protein 1 [Gasterosteus aculeatus aculeatus]
MEAAVLSRAAMPQVDRNGNTVNAELEVKKLQQLVRKLERQNAQLRTRAGPPGGFRDPGGSRLHSPPPSCGSVSPPEEPFGCFPPHTSGKDALGRGGGQGGSDPSVLDNRTFGLRSSALPGRSGGHWLYVSSKAREPRDGSVTPLQWCRRGLRCPESEVEAARRSLSLRLEQVSRWRSSLSSPFSTSSPVPPLRRVAPISSSTPSKPCSTPQSAERRAPSFSSPLHPGLHRALSPVGKDLPPASERTPAFVPAYRGVRRSALRAQASVDGDLSSSGLEEDDDSIALGYKLQDLTDVQVMARLQEESLRQDYACTSSLLANRRSQSFTFQLSAGRDPGEEDEEEEEEEDDGDYGLLPPPQPRLTRLPHSRTFASMRDWRRSTGSLSTPPSAPCSTPPCPSAGFALQAPPPTPGPGSRVGGLCAAERLGFRPGSAKLRRSMPNLVRAPSMPCVPGPTPPGASPSLLRNSQSFDSCGALARLHSSIPSPGQLQHRVHSVGNFPSLSRRPAKATAYVSPTVKAAAASPDCFNLGSSGIPVLGKTLGGAAAAGSAPNTPRSGLPRPASLFCPQSSTPLGKLGQPPRSLLTPPKSFSTLSALRDSSWRDGCY